MDPRSLKKNFRFPFQPFTFIFISSLFSFVEIWRPLERSIVKFPFKSGPTALHFHTGGPQLNIWFKKEPLVVCTEEEFSSHNFPFEFE